MGTFKRQSARFIALLVSISAIASVFMMTGCDKLGEMREMTAAEIVDDMGVGINLGNTFDATGDWIAQYNSDPKPEK